MTFSYARDVKSMHALASFYLGLTEVGAQTKCDQPRCLDFSDGMSRIPRARELTWPFPVVEWSRIRHRKQPRDVQYGDDMHVQAVRRTRGPCGPKAGVDSYSSEALRSWYP